MNHLTPNVRLALAAITALTLLFFAYHHSDIGTRELCDQVAALWVLGVILVCWYVSERNVIISGLLVLYATNWLLADGRILLPHVLTPAKEVNWLVDMAADVAVFGWWAWRLRATP